MAVSKVVFNGDTLMDVTDDSVTAGTLLENETATRNDGVRIVGSAVIPSPSDATPQALGTAGAGSSADYSRADHVHAMPTAANVGAIAAPTSPAAGNILVYDGTSWEKSATRMIILSYGHSTWAEVLAAYQSNAVVYCRASSGSNPGSGSQTRMAFMAYVNNAESPTEIEFQYYRSVATHSDSQQGDQVYVYKINSAGTWSVTTREAYTKIVAGTGLTSSYSNGVLTISLA